jgi:ArsR family transcriptional regulator
MQNSLPEAVARAVIDGCADCDICRYLHEVSVAMGSRLMEQIRAIHPERLFERLLELPDPVQPASLVQGVPSDRDSPGSLHDPWDLSPLGKARRPKQGRVTMRTYLRVMKAVADNVRVKILKMLQYRELCVCEMRTLLGISQPAVSRHLRLLEDADLVRSQKDGMWNNFRLAAEQECNPYSRMVLESLRTWLEDEPQIMELRKRVATVDRATCATALGMGRRSALPAPPSLGADTD